MEISDVLKQSRYDAGKSQQFMATQLQVNLTTIRNWENGYSTPHLDKAIDWFKTLGLSPVPYYLHYLYPDTNVTAQHEDEAIDEALFTCIRACTPQQKRKLLYIFLGEHGSSPSGTLEMINANLQCPLKDRLNIASNILTNYRLAQALGDIQCIHNIQPDLNLLKIALEKGTESVVNRKNSYLV